jgi:SAM-dependent methyltransferase
MFNGISFFEFGMDRYVPDWQAFHPDLPVLHLGPGSKGNRHLGGSETIDCEWPEYDFDREDCLKVGLNRRGWGEGQVGGIVATHVLEHLRDPRILLAECMRVLAPGAPLNIVVPLAGSNLFHQDLDHKTPFVLDTWSTLRNQQYYKKGKNNLFSYQIGFNMEMSIKHGNSVVVTQLIKLTDNRIEESEGIQYSASVAGIPVRHV